MMKSTELYNLAEQKDIIVINGKLSKSPAMSICDNGDCAIVIDDKQIESQADETVKLAHELGHCIKGAFYNKYSQFDLISRHEYRADSWAIKKLIPKDELIETFEDGITEIWELAEHFEVTEEFMIKACEFYGFYHRAI